MANIDTSFTKAELRLLIKLAYTGYYVCGREDDADSKKDAADSLIDRLLQIALTYRLMDGIEFEAESGKHYLDADHEEQLLEEYGDFVEESFWDELIFRLGRRDLGNLVGEEGCPAWNLRSAYLRKRNKWKSTELSSKRTESRDSRFRSSSFQSSA